MKYFVIIFAVVLLTSDLCDAKREKQAKKEKEQKVESASLVRLYLRSLIKLKFSVFKCFFFKESDSSSSEEAITEMPLTESPPAAMPSKLMR